MTGELEHWPLGSGHADLGGPGTGPEGGILERHGVSDRVVASPREALGEGHALHREAQELLASYKRKIAEAEQEAEAIIGEAREEAQRLRAKMTEDLEHSLQRREKLAMDRIAQAETEATQEVRAMASDIALTATRTILEDTVQGDKADRLIDDAIDELPDKLN